MVSGIILAAGTSSRLGQPKQLLELEGKPVLQHVVDAVGEARLGEVIVVLGHDADRIASRIRLPERGRIVLNQRYEAGQSTSVRAGLAAADTASRAAVILLGDQPRVEPWMIWRVVDVFDRHRYPVVRARFGESPGHPVLVARSQWDEWMSVTGDRGARELLAHSPRKVHDVGMGAEPLEDIDTWDQYERLLERGLGARN
jgi:molybdenum cofactor cytidylyltransferase